MTKKFMRAPIEILVKKDELTLEGIKQFFVNVEKEVRFIMIIIRGGGGVQPQKPKKPKTTMKSHFGFFWVFWVLIGYF